MVTLTKRTGIWGNKKGGRVFKLCKKVNLIMIDGNTYMNSFVQASWVTKRPPVFMKWKYFMPQSNLWFLVCFLLQDFTSARYIRLRLQKIRTLNADLMTFMSNDPKDIDQSVTNRVRYESLCLGKVDLPAGPVLRPTCVTLLLYCLNYGIKLLSP